MPFVEFAETWSSWGLPLGLVQPRPWEDVQLYLKTAWLFGLAFPGMPPGMKRRKKDQTGWLWQQIQRRWLYSWIVLLLPLPLLPSGSGQDESTHLGSWTDVFGREVR
jgi:hypothetical protein